MKTIDFIFFDAGGGHRAAATALKSVMDAQKHPVNVRLVNLQEILEPLDVFKKVTGLRLEDVYNTMLAKGWTLGSRQGLVFMHGVIRIYHGSTVRLLTEHWKSTRPDMVVSVVPNFNRAMYESLKVALPAVPYVTVLTDMADFPPHFWIERNQHQYLICGTPHAVQQAQSLGHPAERIFETSGMILRPKFYDPITVNRDQERQHLGLDPHHPTGLVLFGGQGSNVMLDVAQRLENTQLIFICGKNAKLADKLRALKPSARHYIEGFTQEVPLYMHLSDFFIGKPGPGSISEAIAMKLPVIVERNAWTLPQERFNADWVREKKVGIVVANYRKIGEAASQLLANLTQFQQNVSAIQNRAVFEIPEILQSILAKSQSTHA